MLPLKIQYYRKILSPSWDFDKSLLVLHHHCGSKAMHRPILHHQATKAWNVAVRNVTALITSKESTMCTPLLPWDVWTLSNSTICFLTKFSLAFSLLHTYWHTPTRTLSSRPSLLGEHMRRSDPTLILLPLLSIIQSALLGKKEDGRKREEDPQTNTFLLSFWQLCDCNIYCKHRKIWFKLTRWIYAITLSPSK